MPQKEPENSIRRGEIFSVHLDPCFGREIGGYKPRPVAVMSIEDIHQWTRIVVVVPGTTTDRGNLANVVPIDPSIGNGLREKTFFQCHQVRAIDQGRMTGRAIGRLSEPDYLNIQTNLWAVLGWQPKL